MGLRDKPEIKSIVIFSMQGIGNSLLATPLIREVKLNFKDAKLSAIAAKQGLEVLKGNPYIDELLVFPYKGSFFGKIKFILSLRKKKYDVGLIPFVSNNLVMLSIAFLAGIKTRVSHTYKLGAFNQCSFLISIPIAVKEKKHDIERNLELAKSLGINKNFDKEMQIFIPKELDKKAEQFLKSKGINKNDFLVGVHAGSAQPIKRWPAENFARVMDSLSGKYKAKILFFVGPGEEEIKKILNASKSMPIVVEGKGLKEAASLIKKCRLFISNDSGLMHMSVAVNTPTIAIFGPSEVDRAHPLGSRHITLCKYLECSPCYRTNAVKCPKGTLDCMFGISVEDVLKAVDKITKK